MSLQSDSIPEHQRIDYHPAAGPTLDWQGWTWGEHHVQQEKNTGCYTLVNQHWFIRHVVPCWNPCCSINETAAGSSYMDQLVFCFHSCRIRLETAVLRKPKKPVFTHSVLPNSYNGLKRMLWMMYNDVNDGWKKCAVFGTMLHSRQGFLKSCWIVKIC